MSVESYKLERDIQDAIQKQVQEAREAALKHAVSESEKDLRDIIGRTAINIANYFTIERMGTNLVITVNIDGPAKQQP